MGNLVALACDSWHSKFQIVRTVAPVSNIPIDKLHGKDC